MGNENNTIDNEPDFKNNAFEGFGGNEKFNIEEIRLKIDRISEGTTEEMENIEHEISIVEEKLNNIPHESDENFLELKNQSIEVFEDFNYSIYSLYSHTIREITRVLRRYRDKIEVEIAGLKQVDPDADISDLEAIKATISKANKILQEEKRRIQFLKKVVQTKLDNFFDKSLINESSEEKETDIVDSGLTTSEIKETDKKEQVDKTDYFSDVKSFDEIEEILKSKESWSVPTRRKPVSSEKVIEDAKNFFIEGKGSIPKINGLRPAIENLPGFNKKDSKKKKGEFLEEDNLELTENDVISEEGEFKDKEEELKKEDKNKSEQESVDEELLALEEEGVLNPEEAQEIKSLPANEKRKIFEGIANIGLWTTKAKSRVFEKSYGYISEKVKNKTAKKYFSNFSKKYKEEKEKASQSIDTVGKGGMAQLLGTGQGAANILRYGRIVSDFSGTSTLNPLRYFMLVSMFASKAAEVGKETRFENTEVIDKTRIKDCNEAYDEARKIYDSAKNKSDADKVSAKEIQDAYVKDLPADIKKRFEKLGGQKFSGLNWVNFLISKDMAWSVEAINKKIKKIENNNKVSEKDKEIENLIKSYEKILKDLDRMVSREGNLDAIAYGARLTERSSKALVNILTIETAGRFLYSAFEYFDIKERLESVKNPFNKGEKELSILEGKAVAGYPIPERSEHLVSPIKEPEYSVFPKEEIVNQQGMDVTTEHEVVSENFSEKLELATIRKGEGIQNVLIRQLASDPEKFGFEGDLHDAEKIKEWAGGEAHRVYLDYEKIRLTKEEIENGLEIRAKVDGIGKASYILEKDAQGKSVIKEFLDGKELDNKNIEKFEYKYDYNESASPATPIVEKEVVVNETRDENTLGNILEEKVETNSVLEEKKNDFDKPQSSSGKVDILERETSSQDEPDSVVKSSVTEVKNVESPAIENTPSKNYFVENLSTLKEESTRGIYKNLVVINNIFSGKILSDDSNISESVRNNIFAQRNQDATIIRFDDGQGQRLVSIKDNGTIEAIKNDSTGFSRWPEEGVDNRLTDENLRKSLEHLFPKNIEVENIENIVSVNDPVNQIDNIAESQDAQIDPTKYLESRGLSMGKSHLELLEKFNGTVTEKGINFPNGEIKFSDLNNNFKNIEISINNPHNNNEILVSFSTNENDENPLLYVINENKEVHLVK